MYRKMNPLENLNSDMEMSASKTFEVIIDQIKSSNLNFHLQQSPFSAVISLKKTLIKDRSGCTLMPPTSSSILLKKAEQELENMCEKILQLESTVNSIKIKYENAVIDCEGAYKTVSKLENKLEEAKGVKHVMIKQEAIDDIKIEVVEKSMEIEIKMLSALNKKLENENQNLKTTLSEKNKNIVDLEASNKNREATANRLNKALSENKTKYDQEKVEANKDLRQQIKSWRKELGQERKEKIKVEEKFDALKKEVEDAKTNQLMIKSVNTFTQTEEHPDIPYDITSPLPPIFSSQLCHITPKLRFLSKSAFHLDTICWVKPDDSYQEEAEEALNQQYDRNIEEFYLSERDRVRLSRMAELKGNIILNITQESTSSSSDTEDKY